VSACEPNSISRRNTLRPWVLVAVLSLGASIASVAAEPGPLAIKGYDPVAYFTDGKPMRGLPDISYEWNGHWYRFSSAGHRDLFKADPKRYAPQFENYCAMALSKGELVVADPENWLISDGKLYVFGKPAPAGPALFQKDLEGNIAKANQNRSLIPER
jgi:YHS domain-containing protein